MNVTTKSEKITKGMRGSFNDVNSKMANRICYGYAKMEDGSLVINESEASIVTLIFQMYLEGKSLGKISKALEDMSVLSPTGKSKWNKEAINKLISNEKYIGEVLLQKTFSILGEQVENKGELEKVLITNHHTAIISLELFNRVQEIKNERSKEAQRKTE